MANDFLVKSDTAAVQDLLAVHAGPTFRAVLQGWADLGAVKFNPANPRVVPGQKVENPRIATVGALGATNLTTNTSVDLRQAPSSVRGRGPVVSRALMNSTTNGPIAWREDAIRAMLLNEREYLAKVGEDMGKQAARAVKVAFYNCCVGAIATMAAAVRHQKATTSAAVYTDIIDAQKTIDTRRNDIILMVIHPQQLASLEKDLLTASSMHVFNVGDLVVMEGIGRFGKMRIVVDSDVPSTLISGTTYDYYGIMLCEGAAEITPAPASPLITFVETPLTVGVKGYCAQVEEHVGINLAGMDCSGAVDGTVGTFVDSDLFTSSWWTAAYSFDHRDVGIALLKSRG